MLRPLALATALALAAPALAQVPEPAPQMVPAGTITVSGVGEVMVAPDMATLMIGVETRADNAAAAVAQNNAAAQQIIDTLKGAGIEARDIQTANFSVSPVYDETSYQRREGPRIIGYQATNQVVAHIRDLDGMGAVLDATVDSGANRIDGLHFGVENDAEVLAQARRRAVEEARAKAEAFAEAAGVQLGQVRSISEGGWGGPQPMYDMRAAAPEMQAASVPIERGQAMLSANIQITWELDEGD